MLRTLILITLVTTIATSPLADANPVATTCVGGYGGICVLASNGCYGVGLGLQGVGGCFRNGCASVFVGFNEIGTCGIVLP